MSITIDGIDEAVREITNAPQEAIAGMFPELVSKLVEATPVDTGFAQRSWIATNSPEDAGNPGANEPEESALRLARSYKLSDVVYINNGAAYISRLNDGHSDQAPSGFVDNVVREAPSIIDEQIRDLVRSGRR